MNIAQKVRQNKEAHPELYCRVPACLWRIVTQRGPSPCQKHPLPKPVLVEHDDSGAHIARLLAELQASIRANVCQPHPLPYGVRRAEGRL